MSAQDEYLSCRTEATEASESVIGGDARAANMLPNGGDKGQPARQAGAHTCGIPDSMANAPCPRMVARAPGLDSSPSSRSADVPARRRGAEQSPRRGSGSLLSACMAAAQLRPSHRERGGRRARTHLVPCERHLARKVGRDNGDGKGGAAVAGGVDDVLWSALSWEKQLEQKACAMYRTARTTHVEAGEEVPTKYSIWRLARSLASMRASMGCGSAIVEECASMSRSSARCTMCGCQHVISLWPGI
jgi:hypothetical protein